MAFELDKVVPWGRNAQEYQMMFQLTKEDQEKKIAGFGDGPASFNYEMSRKGWSVTSFDPIYQFSKDEIYERIEATRDIVMKQTRENVENFIWSVIPDLGQLEEIRMSAMHLFLEDYECGKREGRYQYLELPNQVPFKEYTFDIGLCSHFLLLYTELGYEFHIQAISEMLRVCKEIRIFPIIDLNAEKSEMNLRVIEFFRKDYEVTIRKTDYEFQKGGNELLIIKNK